MIAKIISHGATRDEARRKLLRGLEDAVALGVTTNQVFLTRCLAHSGFAQGRATTGFIGHHLTELLQTDLETQARAAALAAPLLLETEAGAMRSRDERRLTHRLPINLHFEINGEKRAVSLVHRGQYRYEAEIDSRHFELDLIEIDGHAVRLSCDGVMESAVYCRDGAQLWLRYRGQPFEIEDQTRAASARQDTAGGSDGKLRAVMDGRVVAVFVTVGDRVEARQPIATIEAMKMEHVHEAPVSGIVTALHVSIDEQVPARRVIAEIQADPEPAKA